MPLRMQTTTSTYNVPLYDAKNMFVSPPPPQFEIDIEFSMFTRHARSFHQFDQVTKKVYFLLHLNQFLTMLTLSIHLYICNLSRWLLCSFMLYNVYTKYQINIVWEADLQERWVDSSLSANLKSPTNELNNSKKIYLFLSLI